MILTSSQKQVLGKYLNNVLVYKETYNEMYDHIASGLQNAPQNERFEQSMHNYINAEFGGTKGLKVIEKQYRTRALSIIKREYVEYVLSQFRLPRVLRWTAVGLAFYICYKGGVIKDAWFFPTFFVVAPQLGFRTFTRYIRSFRGKKEKRSVKDSGFLFIRYIPVIFWLTAALYRLVTGYNPREWFRSLSPEVVTLLVVVHLMHVIAFSKIHGRHIRLNLAR